MTLTGSAAKLSESEMAKAPVLKHRGPLVFTHGASRGESVCPLQGTFLPRRTPNARGLPMTVFRRDLQTRQSYTPSSAHDGAYRRGSAHDAMQVSVYKWLAAARDKLSYEGKDGEKLTLRWIIPEYAMKSRGRIVAFADLALIYRFDGDRVPYSQLWHYRLLELKPSIESVGGIIRQCAVLEDVLSSHIAAEHRLSGGGSKSSSVVPVVPFNDPALADLKLLGNGFIPWDMERGCPGASGEQP